MAPRLLFWRAFLSLILIAAPGSVEAAPIATQSTRDPERLISAYYEAAQFNGATLVAFGDRVVVRQGLGLASMEHGVAVGSETRFRIASLTKQFTAAAILKLVEQGQVDLQAPVATYLPALRPDLGRTITVHHLLSHSSGLVRDIDALSGKGIAVPYSMPEMLELVNGTQLQFAPGERAAYSNVGYVLLAMIIEHVTGKSYGDAMDEMIFRPLGMRNTGHEQSRLIIEHRAWGYERLVDGFVTAANEDKSYVTGAGSLYSTLDDLYIWAQALLSDRVVSRQSRDAMFTAQAGAFGYGWSVSTYRTPDDEQRHPRVSHLGASPGFSTSLALYLDHDLIVITLANVTPAPNALWDRLGNAALGFETLLPVQEIDESIYRAVLFEGAEAGLRAARARQAESPLREPTGRDLTLAGYGFLRAARPDRALEIFRYYALRYPEEANAFDSLGEALVALGRKEEALEAYRRALVLDPAGAIGANARRQIDTLVAAANGSPIV